MYYLDKNDCDFTNRFTDGIKEKYPELEGKFKIETAMKGDKTCKFVIYRTADKELQYRAELLQYDSIVNGMDACLDRFAYSVANGEKYRPHLEQIEENIFIKTVNMDFISKNFPDAYSMPLNNTEFCSVFTMFDADRQLILDKDDFAMFVGSDTYSNTRFLEAIAINTLQKIPLGLLASSEKKKTVGLFRKKSDGTVFRLYTKEHTDFSSFGLTASLMRMYKYLKTPFYIFPYTTENIIIVPSSAKVNIKEVHNEILDEIKKSNVPDQLHLSDKIYFYDKKGGLRMAAM